VHIWRAISWGIRAERDLFVYLPPGYEESDRRYPTVYLLQAYGETARQMITPSTDGQRWQPPLEDVLDPVLERMGTAPMIVVIPDGWSRWGCGQWVDSPVTGNFEQYVVHDVVESVDATFRTIPSARSRGVFGFSSGGGSEPGTSPHATRTSSARWRCSRLTPSWT
jgi:enterochelin esterase-like enzyme